MRFYLSETRTRLRGTPVVTDYGLYLTGWAFLSCPRIQVHEPICISPQRKRTLSPAPKPTRSPAMWTISSPSRRTWALFVEYDVPTRAVCTAFPAARHRAQARTLTASYRQTCRSACRFRRCGSPNPCSSTPVVTRKRTTIPTGTTRTKGRLARVHEFGRADGT